MLPNHSSFRQNIGEKLKLLFSCINLQNLTPWRYDKNFLIIVGPIGLPPWLQLLLPWSYHNTLHATTRNLVGLHC